MPADEGKAYVNEHHENLLEKLRRLEVQPHGQKL